MWYLGVAHAQAERQAEGSPGQRAGHDDAAAVPGVAQQPRDGADERLRQPARDRQRAQLLRRQRQRHPQGSVPAQPGPSPERDGSAGEAERRYLLLWV